MRYVDADKLYPDCMTKDGKLAISQSQLANAPTVDCIEFNRAKELIKQAYQKGKDIRQQGEWVVDEDNGILKYMKCSNCGKVAAWLDGGRQFLSNFCPNCGADLRGEEE